MKSRGLENLLALIVVNEVDALRFYEMVFDNLRGPIEGSLLAGDNPWDRFNALVELMETNRELRISAQKALKLLLRASQKKNLYIATGRIQAGSFLQELVALCIAKIAHRGILLGEIDSIIKYLFRPEDTQWIQKLDPTEFVKFLKQVTLSEEATIFRVQLEEALFLVANQIQSVAIQIELLSGEEISKVSSWPETQLASWTQQGRLKDAQEVRDIMFRIFTKLTLTGARYQNSGVSIQLVHLRNQLHELLNRFTLLYDLFVFNFTQPLIVRRMFEEIIFESFKNHHVTPFLLKNLRLLAERIVERQSEAGEHYVTRSWNEFYLMWKSALLGGAVTVITVFLKLMIGKVGLKAFFLGFIEGINYATSFLAIAYVGGTLATKQPSATAPFIAAQLKNSSLKARKSLVALFRTQIVAILGNVFAVAPICFLVSYLWTFTGSTFLPRDKALNLLQSIDILGPSGLFAAMTGVLLFLSSLVGGWFENWVVVHRLKDRLEFQEKLNGNLRNRIARLVICHPSVVAANVSLGLFLGLAPQFLKFFSLPFDVRHVTLATGQVAVALADFGLLFQMEWDNYLRIFSGLVFIGLINVTTSFLLALFLAIASIGLDFTKIRLIFYSSFRLIVRKPWLLFMPEKNG